MKDERKLPMATAGSPVAGDAMADQPVVVRCHWKDADRTATVHLRDLGGVRWDRVGSAPRAPAPWPLLHADISCEAVIEGDRAHSCRQGPGPRSITVRILKGDNAPDVIAELARQAANAPEPGMYVGTGPWEVVDHDRPWRRPSRDPLWAELLYTVHQLAPGVTATLRSDVWPHYQAVHDRLASIGDAGDGRRWRALRQAARQLTMLTHWGTQAPRLDEILALRDALKTWRRRWHLEAAWVADVALHAMALAHRAESAENFWGSPEGPLARALAVRGLPLIGAPFGADPLVISTLRRSMDLPANQQTALARMLEHTDHVAGFDLRWGFPPPLVLGGHRFAGWDPRRVPWEGYETYVRDLVKADSRTSRLNLTAVLGSYRRVVVAAATALGLSETPKKRTMDEHVVWLVRHQVLGQSFGQLAREALQSSAPSQGANGEKPVDALARKDAERNQVATWRKTVAEAVHALGRESRLPPRPPTTGGRPRRPQT